MSDDDYGICMSCRHCSHRAEVPMCCGTPPDEIWVCLLDARPVNPRDGCPRYRPGCCDSCNSLNRADGVCTLTGEAVEAFDVCGRYDPRGIGPS